MSMKIFEKLKIHADRKGYSATQLANNSGKSQQSVSNYFSGKNQIPLDWLVWYLGENPEIDVVELFNQESENLHFIKEDRKAYPSKNGVAKSNKDKKQILLDKISKILDEEL